MLRRAAVRRPPADAAAVLRCLGLSSRGLLVLFVTRLLALAAAATVLGSLVGLGAQAVLGALVGRWFAAELPRRRSGRCSTRL